MKSNKKAKSLLIYLLITILGVTLFLFSPKPNEHTEYCGNYVKINSIMGFVKNCDSEQFHQIAENPKTLLEEKEIRQSRPLYIIIGYILGNLFKFIGQSLNIGPIIVSNLVHFDAFDVGYILFNLILLITSLLLFDKILTQLKIKPKYRYLLATFLVINNVVKAFFWTTHQQMFVIFSPLLLIYLMLRILKTKDKHLLVTTSLISLVCGILFLTYGNFTISLPCIAVAYLVRNNWKINLKKDILFAAIWTVLFALPMLIWIFILKNTAGYYYNHAMEHYRQLVWILDYLQQGIIPFIKQFFLFSSWYFLTFTLEIIPFILITALGFFYSKTKNENKSKPNKSQKNSQKIELLSLTTLLGFFFFFWILGYYEHRLTFTIVPPMLILVASRLRTCEKQKIFTSKQITIFLVISIIIWTIIHLVTNGPYD